MRTLATFVVPEDFQHVPQVPYSEVQHLWNVDYWKGPIAGMLRYQGERLWFQLIGGTDSLEGNRPRQYAIIRLTREQCDDERLWHAEFFNAMLRISDPGSRSFDWSPMEVMQGREQIPECLVTYRERNRPDYSQNEIVGWFEM
jgi:hypothetical protein